MVAATGFRPDLAMLGELRLDLDPAVESPRALAPLIDPNVHSCGTVPPHGAVELSHPEPGFYVVGMKSYGRAPTFLMLTGYEQVRSVVAALAGDMDAARRVELVLPQTGVCSAAPVGEPAESASSATAEPAAVSAAACCGPATAAATGESAESACCGTGAAGETATVVVAAPESRACCAPAPARASGADEPAGSAACCGPAAPVVTGLSRPRSDGTGDRAASQRS